MGQKRGVTLFSSKRALSPLIATVMLIAFAVALGAVVMNWGKGYIEESTISEGEVSLSPAPAQPTAPCEQAIQLQVLTIGGRPDICTRAGIQGYPTWIIKDQRFEGELTLAQLSQASGCALP